MLGGLGQTLVAPQLRSSWALLATREAYAGHALATVDFTEGFDGSFDKLRIEFTEVGPVTAARDLWLRVFQNGVLQSGAADYEWVLRRLSTSTGTQTIVNSTGSTRIELTSEPTSTVAIEGEITFSVPQLSKKRGFRFRLWEQDTLGADKTIISDGGGRFITNLNPIDGVRLQLSGSGGFSAGRFSLFGLRRAAA